MGNPLDWVDLFGLAGCEALSKIDKSGKVLQSTTTKKGIQKVDRIFNNKNETQNWASKQLGASKERIYDNNGKWIEWQNKAGDQVYWGHGDWGKGQGSSTFPHLNYDINGTKGHLFLKDKIINRNQLGEFIEYFNL